MKRIYCLIPALIVMFAVVVNAKYYAGNWVVVSCSCGGVGMSEGSGNASWEEVWQWDSFEEDYKLVQLNVHCEYDPNLTCFKIGNGGVTIGAVVHPPNGAPVDDYTIRLDGSN